MIVSSPSEQTRRPPAASGVVVPKPLRWHQRFLASFVYGFIRLIDLTLFYRWEIHPEALEAGKQPMIFIAWHNRLFLSAEIFRRYHTRRAVHGLVSASKDGAWLAAFYRLIGIIPVRGSSSNFGREAGKALIDVMRQGHDIGITPDGPRGPMYVVEPGVLVVTRRNRAPMVLLGAEFTRAWRLKSWDRFYIPVPFSRIIMRCTILPPIRADGEKLGAADVRTALMAINPDRT